jgi:branched-chain amino acid aminotransferase
MNIAQLEFGVPVEERSIDRTEMYICDELFLCGTGAQIAPVIDVDNRPVGGTGVIGPVTRKIMDVYNRAVHGEDPRFSDWLTPVYRV